MKNVQSLKYLMALLFFYAGFSKLFEISLFEEQMYKSPLLPMWIIPFVAYALPIVEILIATCIFIERTIKFALFCSFIIMFVFTIYLLCLYLFFPYEEIPCSCGGILGNMSYGVHIIFNIIFTVMAGGLYLLEDQKKEIPAG